jgi:hypothetical protein
LRKLEFIQAHEREQLKKLEFIRANKWLREGERKTRVYPLSTREEDEWL